MGPIDDAFQNLLLQFNTSTIFWRLGNAFDTMLDYLALNPAEAGNINENAVARFKASQGNEAWYDDDGWWLIATIKAVELSEQLGWDKSVLMPKVAETWDRFSSNGPFVWQRDGTQLDGHYAPLKPLITGGVWNSYWSTPGHPVCDPTDPTDILQGIQNTVTNGLFMVGAQRLANSSIVLSSSPGAGDPATAADTEFGFLSAWFGVPPNGADSLLNTVGQDAVVVRERVTAYDSSQEVYGYDKDQAWLGDQGLILGALVARIKAGLDPDGQALTWAMQILKGVPIHLGDPTTKVLSNWPSLGPPGNDPGDYSTGSGVFFRYLLDAWNSVPDLQAFMKQLGWPQIVRANIGAPTPPPAHDQPPYPLVVATNALAVLLADQAMN